MFETEYETNLNRASLHIYTEGTQEDDYQLPMLQRNQITGLLSVEECEMEGKHRYTYDIRGQTAMKTMYEKEPLRRDAILQFVTDLLELTDRLQKYMLETDCLLLDPEYIFCKEGKWYFCYLPTNQQAMKQSFHKLTEYFVKKLDYSDTEGIFLTYELHKATLHEHYDLTQIMQEYAEHEKERNEEREAKSEEEENSGNLFSLVEEEDLYEAAKPLSLYEDFPASRKPDMVREERESIWKTWKKSGKQIKKRRWGSWRDLILEGEENAMGE